MNRAARRAQRAPTPAPPVPCPGAPHLSYYPSTGLLRCTGCGVIVRGRHDSRMLCGVALAAFFAEHAACAARFAGLEEAAAQDRIATHRAMFDQVREPLFELLRTRRAAGAAVEDLALVVVAADDPLVPFDIADGALISVEPRAVAAELIADTNPHIAAALRAAPMPGCCHVLMVEGGAASTVQARPRLESGGAC